MEEKLCLQDALYLSYVKEMEGPFEEENKYLKELMIIIYKDPSRGVWEGREGLVNIGNIRNIGMRTGRIQDIIDDKRGLYFGKNSGKQGHKIWWMLCCWVLVVGTILGAKFQRFAVCKTGLLAPCGSCYMIHAGHAGQLPSLPPLFLLYHILCQFFTLFPWKYSLECIVTIKAT